MNGTLVNNNDFFDTNKLYQVKLSLNHIIGKYGPEGRMPEPQLFKFTDVLMASHKLVLDMELRIAELEDN